MMNNGIEISVKTCYEPGFSNSEAKEYIFSFEITLDNN